MGLPVYGSQITSLRVTALVFGLYSTLQPLSGGDLYGRIADPSGAGVPGSKVVAYSKSSPVPQTKIAGEDGVFRFHRLPAGEYMLEASAANFTRSDPATVSVPAEGDVTVDLSLSLESLASRIVVTASAAAQAPHQVAKAVSVIGSNEMARRGEWSLGETLRLTPGLRVQSLGGPGAFTRVISRGLRTQDTAVAVDGLRFRDAATTQGDASPFLEALFPVNAGRVEVLRGTGSSLYGSHAVGGVINVVTGEGGGPMHGELLAEGGGLGLMRAAAKAAGGIRSDRLTYSLGVQHLDVSSGVDGDDPSRNTTGQGSLHFRPNPAASLSARIWTADSFVGLNDSPFAAPAAALPPAGPIPVRALPLEALHRLERGETVPLGAANLVPNINDPDSRRASTFLAAALVFNSQLGPRASFRASYQKVITNRRFEEGPAGVRFEPAFPVSDRVRGGIDTIQARTDLRVFSWNTLSAGVEHERESYSNRHLEFPPEHAGAVNYRATAKQNGYSYFFQNQSTFGNLHLAVSGRAQSFRLSPPEFTGGASRFQEFAFADPPLAKTGDASAAWFIPATGTKIRAHVGNGYRAPSVFERIGTSFFDGTFTPLGDPRLRPDRNVAFDAGIDQYLANQKVRISATHFYTNLQEVIAFDSSGSLQPAGDPLGRSSGYINTGGGLARGVELNAEASPRRGTNLTASYTYTNSELRRSSVRGNDFFKMPYVSDHQFSLLWMQQITSRLDFAFDVTALSEHAAVLSSRAFLFPGARRADVAVNYTHPLSDRHNLRLYARLRNAFDGRYLENGFRTPGRWATAGMQFMF